MLDNIIKFNNSLLFLVDLREESATHGYEKDPAFLAAVGNFGQCAQAWPSEIVVLMKAMEVVKVKQRWK